MRYETKTVDITLGDQKFDTQYEAKIYESISDILEEAQSSDKDKTQILKNINMAEDWNRRTKARTEYMKDGDAAIAKSFEDQVKAYMAAREKANKPVTVEQARAKVKAMMEDCLVGP